MRTRDVKFCLMIVTTEGWAPVLSCATVTQNVREVRELDDIYQRLRPGFGREYLTHITRIDENLAPLDQELATLERYSCDLKKRSLRQIIGAS